MPVCEQHQQLADDVHDIKIKINGNGRPGIVERLSKIEAKINLLLWVIGAVAVPTVLDLVLKIK